VCACVRVRTLNVGDTHPSLPPTMQPTRSPMRVCVRVCVCVKKERVVAGWGCVVCA
jgi:hypothetical protein